MEGQDWGHPSRLHMGFIFSGDAIDEVNETGERILGDTIFCYFNAGHKNVRISLPRYAITGRWLMLLDTMDELFKEVPIPHAFGDRVTVHARSQVLFRLQKRRVGG
jgi:hypothetical protein